jgi:hypothetical protein
MKIALLRILALLSAFACISLVGTIEALNARAGNAIGRKQRQEPHSKWRTGSLGLERMITERKFRLEWELHDDQALSSVQSAHVERVAQQRWTKALPHERLARVMKTYSAWGLPLGIAAFTIGAMAWPKQQSYLRAACCSIGILALIIAVVRYIPSLGW